MSTAHLAIALVVCLVWAGNFLFSSFALTQIPPFAFTTLRLAVLAVLLAPALRLPPREWRLRIAAVALLNGVLHFGLNFWALAEAGNLASPAIVLQTWIPMATVLAVLFLGERIGWPRTLGILTSFAGVLLLGFDPDVLAKPRALALMLTAALMLAAGTVLMRGLRGISVFQMQAWTAALGVLPAGLLSLWLEPSAWAAVQVADRVAWFGVAWSALAASLVGHGLLYWLVQRHPVSAVTPYLLLTPLFAIGLGVAFHGDSPGWRLLAGGALVLLGVLVVAIRSRPAAEGPDEPLLRSAADTPARLPSAVNRTI